MQHNYELTNNWFESVGRLNWDQVFSDLNPKRILEIGSFEGASAIYSINHLKGCASGGVLVCIDTWEGGIEHKQLEMEAVEARFQRNVALALCGSKESVSVRALKCTSHFGLASMLLNDEEPFDFIYIDGSHQAADVLLDACLAFKLLRKGGVLCFDDYTWKYPIEHGGILMSPKMGIDSFLNVHHDQVRYLMMPLYQLFIIKV